MGPEYFDVTFYNLYFYFVCVLLAVGHEYFY